MTRDAEHCHHHHVAPLIISTIELGAAKLGICALPGSSRSLESDLETIADWQASVVVSLTEQAEMDAVGSGDIGQRTSDIGLTWHHLPIPDFGHLEEKDAGRWSTLAKVLHADLDQGKKVLVHCRGGMGRSGMIVMRLLVERGMLAEDAVSRIRSIRPGAVETDAQYAWAADGESE